MQAEKLKNGKSEAFTKINWLWQHLTGILAPVILTLLVRMVVVVSPATGHVPRV